MKPKTIDDLAGACREQGDQLCYQICPICHNEGWNFNVHPDRGLYHCWICGAGGKIDVGGSLEEVGARLRASSEAEQAPLLDELPCIDWPEDALNGPGWASINFATITYLEDRKIDRRYKLVSGHRSLDGRIVIPYFNRQQALIYWNSRDITGRALRKYVAASGPHPIYYLPEAGYPAINRQPLVIVEGCFDAMAVHSATGNAVAALGGKVWPRRLRHQLLDLVPPEGVIIALDGDAPAQSLQLINQFPMSVPIVKVISFAPGDDPASVGRDKLREMLCTTE